jgi:uncharacterized protein (DUF111 family)
MKLMYIDCGMGAAGDMLTGALLELLDEKVRADFVTEFNSLGIPGVVMETEPSVKCGISGTHVHIKINGVEEGEHMHDHHHEHTHVHEHSHHHSHNGMHEIGHIVRDHLALHDYVKDNVMKVYDIIADAESKAHGVPVTDIHFHEVGTMDAVADVTAVCMLIDRIKPQKILASPVNVGGGTVKCAHGILPVPAPATANILEGIPSYSGDIKSELCTPTGAALLKHFAEGFTDRPELSVERCGYGMGTKDFERANCVKISLGESL